jgi:NTE family protein
MKKKYKTGLVLSGGGTRGFAHLGVIAALKEKGIQPDVISGTSVGAIVGAFIAGGKSPDEVMQIFKKGGFFKYTNLHIPKDGLLKLKGLQEVIQKEIPYKNIEELPLPFWLAVSNLNKGTVEYKNSGPLDRLVLASSSIPVLFSPVEVGGQMYVDGGLMDNLPVEPVKDDCEHIITVNISPINPREKITNLVQIALRTFYMSVNANMQNVRKHSSLYIEPAGIDTYDIFSLSRATELYKLGYQTVQDRKIPF